MHVYPWGSCFAIFPCPNDRQLKCSFGNCNDIYVYISLQLNIAHLIKYSIQYFHYMPSLPMKVNPFNDFKTRLYYDSESRQTNLNISEHNWYRAEWSKEPYVYILSALSWLSKLTSISVYRYYKFWLTMATGAYFPIQTAYSAGSLGTNSMARFVLTSRAPKQPGSNTPKVQWKYDS